MTIIPSYPMDYIGDPPPYTVPPNWYPPYTQPRPWSDLTMPTSDTYDITAQELMKAEAAQAEKDKRINQLEKEIETLEEALVEAEQEVLIREARIDILLSLLHNMTEPKADTRQLELPLVAR